MHCCKCQSTALHSVNHITSLSLLQRLTESNQYFLVLSCVLLTTVLLFHICLVMFPLIVCEQVSNSTSNRASQQ